MKKPEALVSLLEELQAEALVTDVSVHPSSKVVVYTDPDATEEEDGLTLVGEDLKLLFANIDTVERLLDALNNPDEASICFFDLSPSHSVMDFVERRFVAVDEG